MDDDSRLCLVIVGILLILAAVFAITETALSSVSKNRIKVLADRGDSRAKNVLFALENFDRAISTLLICTNIVHIVAAALVTVTVTRLWGLPAVSISTLITTIVVFFVGEMLPKSIAKKNSEKCILRTAGLLCVLMKVLSPFAFILGKIGTFVAEHSKSEAEVSVTEEEIYDIIEDMEEEGTIDENQGDLIASALSFSDVNVEAILTPRVDMVAIDIEDSNEEILKLVSETNHSRVPVYEKTTDNIIGVLQIRKFFSAYMENGRQVPDLRPLLDEVYFAPTSTNIKELLEEMSREKINMSVIVDNYGGTMGIVTVEDILEEIVGEIWDEDDVIEEPMVKLAEDVYLSDADETVETLFEFMEYEDPEANEEFLNLLISEWALQEFQSIPEVGDTFFYHNLKIRVDAMDHNRILKLKVEVLESEIEADEAAESSQETAEAPEKSVENADETGETASAAADAGEKEGGRA